MLLGKARGGQGEARAREQRHNKLENGGVRALVLARWCARGGALGGLQPCGECVGVHGTAHQSAAVASIAAPNRSGRLHATTATHRCKTCAFRTSRARALPSTKLSRAPGRANLSLHWRGRSRAARRSNHRAPSRSNSSTPSCSQMSRRSSRAESTAINPRHGVGDGPPQTSRIERRSNAVGLALR